MNNRIIVPFSDKEGGVYELNVDLDKLSKGEMLNAIVGIGRTKDTFVSKTNKAKKPGDKEIVPCILKKASNALSLSIRWRREKLWAIP